MGIVHLSFAPYQDDRMAHFDATANPKMHWALDKVVSHDFAELGETLPNLWKRQSL